MLNVLGAADNVKSGGAVTVRLTVVVCTNAPEVPVMVTVVGPPTVAEALAVRVRTLVVLVLVGLNDAVTPLGKVDVTARLTLPENPPVGFTVIVLVPLPPCTMLSVLGAADRVKLCAGLTVRLMVVVWTRVPEVPVTVTATGPPKVAEALAVSVNRLVVVVLVGLKDAVTPVGNVEVTARLTLPVKPLMGLTVIVLVPLPPWAMLKVLGDADSEKFFDAVTVRFTVVVCVRAPEVPVTVTATGPPTVAVALAVSVNTLVVVVLAGLNDAVTPAGKVDVTARFTLPVNPCEG